MPSIHPSFTRDQFNCSVRTKLNDCKKQLRKMSNNNNQSGIASSSQVSAAKAASNTHSACPANPGDFPDPHTVCQSSFFSKIHLELVYF